MRVVLTLRLQRLIAPPFTPAWAVVLNSAFLVAVAVGGVAFARYLFYYRSTIVLYAPFLFQAAVTTFLIALVSLVLAVILGAIATWARMHPANLLRLASTLYVEFVRGTPTLVQLLVWGFGIGGLLGQLGFDPRQIAFDIMTVLHSNRLVSPLFNFIFYGIVGLGFNYGAYLSEVFRSGIEGIPQGQTEASLSLGLSPRQTMGRIILPQAILIMFPPFTNNFITLIQDCALLTVIGVPELQNMTSTFANPITDPQRKLFIYILGALFYFALCYPLSRLSRYCERRFSRGGTS
ncbi:amino acid ABC transporter permease [Parathermosynechococcus lividus]